MPRKKKEPIPRLIIPENATLRQSYARAREEFTAADLQQFTEIDEGVPVEQILAELEAIQRRGSRVRRKQR
jgi:hypothetical protein